MAKKSNGIETLTVFAFALVVALPVLAYEAWVAAKLWRWFVVPAFHTAPLHVGVVMGLLTLANLVTAKSVYDPRTPTDRLGEQIAAGIIIPSWLLLLGFAVHSWWM